MCASHARQKNQRKNAGASEVVGTLLLVTIGISLFALLAIITISMPYVFFSSPTPSANIVGMVEGSSVVLEHHGGQSISLDTKITVMFAETPVVVTVGDVLDSESKSDGQWNIGERLVIPYNNPNLPIMQISVTVTDTATNSIVMRGIIQEGSQVVLPTATTLNADSITPNTAVIHMGYDFHYYIGEKKICFTYVTVSDFTMNNSCPWNTTGWISVVNQNGTYSVNILDLCENTQYFYEAWVQYNSSSNVTQKISTSGTVNMFRTESYSLGLWHFDENTGLIAIDSSYHGNNGTLFPPDVRLAPQRLNMTNAVSNNSLHFDGVNDYVVVSNTASLSPTNEIAVEAWVKPERMDDYTGVNIQRMNSTMFGTQAYGCLEPDILKISPDRYVIVSRNSGYAGFVITVQISNQGDITENATTSVCDIFQFENSHCETPKIIKVNASADVYAIVYRGPSNYLYMSTVQIAPNGKIVKGVLGRVPLETLNCYYPDISFVTGNYYAVAYTSYEYYLAANRYIGKIQTVNITSAGAITPKVSYFNFGSAGTVAGIMQYPNIIKVSGDYYSIIFRDSDTDGALRAVQIKSNGSLTCSDVIYKFDVDNISDLPLRVVHVYDKIYAILYGDKDGDLIRGAAVRTVKIASDGTLEDAVGYSKILPPADWTQFTEPSSIIRVSSNVFAVSYRISTRAEVKTFEVSNAGVITNHTNDAAWKYVFQPASSYTIYSPKIICLSSFFNTYAVVYPKIVSPDTNNGVLVTMNINNNGTIVKNLLDSVWLGPVNFYKPDIIHITGDIYAVVCRNVMYGGISLHTIHISNGGRIDNHFIDTLNIDMPDATPGLSIRLVYVTDQIYMIVFDNNINNAVNLKTVKIAADGEIGDSVLFSYNLTKAGYRNYCSPNVIRIKDTVFAISYHSTNYASKSDLVSTIKVSLTGNITLIDTYTTNTYFSSISGYDEYTDILSLEGSNHLYAILYGYDYFYSGHRGLGVIITIGIDDNGIINQVPFSTFTFNTYGCSRPDFIHVNKTVYALTYSYSVSASNYQISGFIQTISIPINGTMIRQIDLVPFSTVNTNYDLAHGQILDHMYKDVYALVYTVPSGSTAKGYVATLRINSNGSIYRLYDNTLFNAQLPLISGADVLPAVVNISNNVITVCYQGDYDDGYIETIALTISDTGSTLKNIISKAGSYALRGNRTVFTATITTTSGDKTLSLPLHNGWNYLVFTYDHSQFKFFNNLTNVSLACNENIRTSSTPLVFGGFCGIYDEIALYKTHLRDDEIFDHFMRYTP